MSETGGSDSGGPFENASFTEQMGQYGAQVSHHSGVGGLPGIAGIVGGITVLLGIMLLFVVQLLVMALSVTLLGVALVVFGLRQERKRARQLLADAQD